MRNATNDISINDGSFGRVKYWDIAKGIVIMLMILGHTDQSWVPVTIKNL